MCENPPKPTIIIGRNGGWFNLAVIRISVGAVIHRLAVRVGVKRSVTICAEKMNEIGNYHEQTLTY